MLFGKEVWAGCSLEQYDAARELLEENGIEYKTKTESREDVPPLRGSARELTGRVGEIPDTTMRYIYVKKAEYAEAEALLNAAGR